jgi:hypothetical protein
LEGEGRGEGGVGQAGRNLKGEEEEKVKRKLKEETKKQTYEQRVKFAD